MNDSLVKSTIVMVIVEKKNSDREIKKESCENEGKREYGRERENESQPQSRGARSLIITSLNLIDVVPTTGKERGRGGRTIKRRGTY